MAHLTDNAQKMAIVDRLVKEGAIDFAEALKLLEVEVVATLPYQPFFDHLWRPNEIRYDGTPAAPFLSPITCSGGATTVTLTPEMLANCSFTAKN